MLQWLPGRCTQRTINRLYLHIPIYLNYNGGRGLEISEGQTPYGISTNKRITKLLLKKNRPVVCKQNPFQIALKYQQLYEQTGSMTTVGKQFGVSRVRIHQILNLLKLDQRIIDYIQEAKNPKQSKYWNEHKLRSIAKLPQRKQYERFLKTLRL